MEQTLRPEESPTSDVVDFIVHERNLQILLPDEIVFYALDDETDVFCYF